MTQKIMEMILRSLGLSPEDLKWLKPKMGCREAQNPLQLNSYRVCPDPGSVMGLAPHTDSSPLAVVHESSIIGLRVQRDGIGWVPMHPVSDALMVNVGDLMQVLSNGRFKSTPDRSNSFDSSNI